jgi:glycosyltransferase involved in cell wall biosynthesis
MATVSVIIPLFNKGKYIGRALNSVFQQTFQDYEIVVVNDGSTDDGAAIVSSLSDSRIRLINQKNSGVGAARNKGIRESSSKYIAFLDADDEWLPEYLELSVRHLELNPDCKFCISGYMQDYNEGVYENNKINVLDNLSDCGVEIFEGSWMITPSISDIELRYILVFFHTNSVFVCSDVFSEGLGFFEMANYGEDSYLWLILLMRYKFYREPRPLSWYHDSTSELGGSYCKRPLEVYFIYFDEIFNRCPSRNRFILKRWYALTALQAAHNRLSVGKYRDVEFLLSRFIYMYRYDTIGFVKLIIKYIIKRSFHQVQFWAGR